jgi:hypothetical protein
VQDVEEGRNWDFGEDLDEYFSGESCKIVLIEWPE